MKTSLPHLLIAGLGCGLAAATTAQSAPAKAPAPTPPPPPKSTAKLPRAKPSPRGKVLTLKPGQTRLTPEQMKLILGQPNGAKPKAGSKPAKAVKPPKRASR